MTRQWWCPTCRGVRGEPVQCAPLRCYCAHTDCPAYHSYVQLADPVPIKVRQTTNTTWDDRTHTTWIDNL